MLQEKQVYFKNNPTINNSKHDLNIDKSDQNTIDKLKNLIKQLITSFIKSVEVLRTDIMVLTLYV